MSRFPQINTGLKSQKQEGLILITSMFGFRKHCVLQKRSLRASFEFQSLMNLKIKLRFQRLFYIQLNHQLIKIQRKQTFLPLPQKKSTNLQEKSTPMVKVWPLELIEQWFTFLPEDMSPFSMLFRDIRKLAAIFDFCSLDQAAFKMLKMHLKLQLHFSFQMK